MPITRSLLPCLILLTALVLPTPARAQTSVPVTVEVRTPSGPAAGAQVIAGATSGVTSDDGIATFELPPGELIISTVLEGYEPASAVATVVAGTPLRVTISLELPSFDEEITVEATRTGARLSDQPTRVEVLEREEIEEKLMMTPGDIVMMLNEMGGLRVQATSPGLGAASVRIQGMRGRYTRFFSDGLPLFGEVGGLGLLQIPPMDLGQVEVIKGGASSLYGAGAMGGVVNLISRRPGSEPEREFLLNQSTRGGTDAIAWLSTAAHKGWSATLLGGGHFQNLVDVSGDDWADLPGYSRGIIRPRVFWDDGTGRSLFATVGVMTEEREGGGRPSGTAYREALDTTRIDAGLVGQTIVNGRYVVTARGAVMRQWHEHEFGLVRERDRHGTIFGEVAVRTARGNHVLVAGAALERSSYEATDLPEFDYGFTVPGIFIQDDMILTPWLAVSASARLDRHSEYGVFFSPRVAARLTSGAWTSRVSVGTGFFGPTPLTEDTDTAGLSNLRIPQPLVAERGRTAMVDLGRTDGPLSYSITAFHSRVTDPIRVERVDGLELTNANGPSTTAGAELLATLRREPISVTASYTYVRATDRHDGIATPVALTPRHSAGAVAMWEREEVGRVGLELYFTGAQQLEDNPFEDVSRAYTIVGLLVERRFGRLRLFVNGENLTGVRQTRWSPLVRPTPASDGRWTVDAWAPLDGRTINGGIRIQF